MALRADEKLRVQKAWAKKLTEEGELLLSDESSRSQAANKVAVVECFFKLLEKALTKKKKRIPIKKPKAVKEKQVDEKKKRGEIKKLRRKPKI